MRILITLDGSSIGERAAAAVSKWFQPGEAELSLLLVVHPEDIHATADGHFFPIITPKGAMGGQPLNIEDQHARVAETRGQALERARADADAYLHSIAQRHFPGATVRALVDFDEDVPKAIVETAEKQGVDMIVMSTHGRTGLRHVILGSVAEEVVRKATSPVMVVGPKARERLDAE
jgi:nucleotide-binding universal stress UspA family protein